MGFAQLANIIANPRELAKFFGFAPIIVGDIIIDVLRSETPVFEYEITERPVEAGLDITDNRLKRPTGLNLDFVLTDTVLDPASITAAVSAGVLTGGLPPLTASAKYAAFKELAEKNQIIDVYTPLDSYTNMMIKTLRFSQDKDTASAAFGSVELREVRIVASEINILDSAQLPAKIKQQETQANKDMGKKTSTQAQKGKQGTSATSSKDSSTLFDLFG